MPKKSGSKSEGLPKSEQHSFLTRVIANRELAYDNGYLYLMGVPSFLFALNSLVVFQKTLSEDLGQKGASIFYHLLGYQAANAAKMMMNRFGFPIEKAMRMQQGHLDMLGAGKVDFVRIDMKSMKFVLRGEPTFAKEYLKTFGIQKESVDWMVRGGAAYMLNAYLGRDDLVGVETSCIAQGAKYCEFVVCPKSQVTDDKLKKQLPSQYNVDLLKIVEKNAMGMPKRK
ncbi:4-vinyl reductase [Candidatus Woesearchaeota archaeon]|nr:4-vinyl reductase [Candidatus Woesearchaeota archaeon]